MANDNTSKSKEYFGLRFTFNKGRDTIWRSISKYIQRYVPKGSSVLDLGAGYCNFINNIQAKEKYAVDIFPDFKKHAAHGVKVFVAQSSKMGFLKNESIDVVFASNLFEHLSREDLNSTISEIKRILRKKGKLILIQPNFRYAFREYFDDYTHRLIFTDVGLSDLMKSRGFEIEKMQKRFLPFSMNARLPKSGILTYLYLISPIKPFAKQMLLIAMKK